MRNDTYRLIFHFNKTRPVLFSISNSCQFSKILKQFPSILFVAAKFTLALCPGIANSSECIYLRTFASYAQTHGFRVAILNHLGALKSEKLTSPRVFTYGMYLEKIFDFIVNFFIIFFSIC